MKLERFSESDPIMPVIAKPVKQSITFILLCVNISLLYFVCLQALEELGLGEGDLDEPMEPQQHSE